MIITKYIYIKEHSAGYRSLITIEEFLAVLRNMLILFSMSIEDYLRVYYILKSLNK